MGEGDITLGVRGISYWAEEAMACRQQSVKEGRGGVRMKPVSVQRARKQKYATWERRLWSTDDSAPCKLITTVDASDASNVERLIGSEGARVRDDEAGCAASSIERVLATVEVERRAPLVVGEAGGEGRGHAGDDELGLGLAIFLCLPLRTARATFSVLAGAQLVSKIRQICEYAGEREVMFLIKSNFFNKSFVEGNGLRASLAAKPEAPRHRHRAFRGAHVLIAIR